MFVQLRFLLSARQRKLLFSRNSKPAEPTEEQLDGAKSRLRAVLAEAAKVPGTDLGEIFADMTKYDDPAMKQVMNEYLKDPSTLDI